ncbi:MAG: hypothetical protein WCS31_10890 [Verrucomicrobiae bacterium]
MKMKFLEELTKDVIESSRVRPGQKIDPTIPSNTTGGTLIRPGGRGCYPSFWIRDYTMSVESGFITLEEQRHALLLTAATQQAEDWQTPKGSLVPRGAIADHINFDGIPIYFPGTFDPAKQGGDWGKLPALDDHFYFVDMAWQYCRQAGQRDILHEKILGLTLLERLELAFAVPPSRADTQLVWSDESNRGVSFGFTDAVIHTGELLFASALRYQAARQLADLTGNSRYSDIADAICDSIPETFAHPGGLLRASTGMSSQPDVWGSAYAVYNGAVTGKVSERICSALADAFRAGTLAWKGNIRHVLTSDDFSDQSAWESTVSCPFNRYQNGAYWNTPTGWVCFAIAQADESLARQLADDYIEELIENDFRKGPEFGAPYECLHPEGGYRTNPVYMTSVTGPLTAFRRIWAQ